MKGELSMEIERINENTVKFYVSYVDIEDRGFEREEIWYDRERSEQLFWQMMDEVNYKEDFQVDGPLWIQVQALEKGLEITVTKAQISKDGEDIELPEDHEAAIDVTLGSDEEDAIDEKIQIVNQRSEKKIERTKQKSDDENLVLVTKFTTFEDAIQLSHYVKYDEDKIDSRLYYLEEKYYMYLEFSSELEDEYQEDFISQLFEYTENSNITYHYLEEYGKAIISEHALTQLRTHFPA